MGRIDEALKRAAENTLASPTIAATATPFSSPWSIDPAPDSTPVPERAVALPRAPRAERFSGFASDWSDRLVVCESADHVLVEQFRQLAGALHQAQAAADIKVLMVTSALEGDGKTLTALNLALTLSGSYGRSVLLVEADLRRPSFAKICGIKNADGLSEALRSVAEQRLAVISVGEGLTLLPAGRPDPDPMSSLTSSRMQSILRDAAEKFDWVILDAPPVVPLADAGLLAAMSDRVLLVVRARQTPREAALKAIDALGRDRIFGVLLNAVAVEEFDASAYAYASNTER